MRSRKKYFQLKICPGLVVKPEKKCKKNRERDRWSNLIHNCVPGKETGEVETTREQCRYREHWGNLECMEKSAGISGALLDTDD